MEATLPPVPPQLEHRQALPPLKPRTLILFLSGLALFILGLITGTFGTRSLNQSPPPPQSNPTINPSSSPAPISNPTASWKIYSNSELGISFKYPQDMDDSCCNISMPNSQPFLVLAKKSTVRPNTDKPFDGLAISVSNIGNQTFDQFVDSQKNLLIATYKELNGSSPQQTNDPRITVGDREGVLLTGYSLYKTEFAYITMPDTKLVLTLAKTNESQGSFDALFGQILSTFKFIESQTKADGTVSDSQIRNIAFAPQTDVNNGGTWRSYSSNTGFSMQYPTHFRISGPEKFSNSRCSVYFINDVGGFISASVVPYTGGSRRELYGITPGYDYRFEDVFIQDSYKSLIIEKGPAGDSGSGTGVVIPVGKNALVVTWTNISKDTPAFNELLGSIRIFSSLNTNKCGS